MGGLKANRTASFFFPVHIFIENPSRELGVEAAPVFRLANPFDPLLLAI